MNDRLRAGSAAGAELLLRRWTEADLPAVRDAFNAPGMYRQFGSTVENGEVDDAAAGRWIARVNQRWDEESAYSWAVAEGPTVLGCVSVSQVNHVHNSGWTAYWTVPAAQGRGVATAAVRALSAWCFDELQLFRLELGHRMDNPASCRVALAAGYRAEGLQRAKLRYGAVRHDVETHARLASD
ncbi:GNAT family N-acetyltransferase [Streptomyces sp. NBRC 109706]|uniref:GNAT family N-acetyltransferase n=1 Tax=Streptomyces sp. NBRC 109706 TaxID=1550035 RepID=UPI00078102E3|nr:GNAT family protein [Streptomyces sp. NBRC 109706]